MVPARNDGCQATGDRRSVTVNLAAVGVGSLVDLAEPCGVVAVAFDDSGNQLSPQRACALDGIDDGVGPTLDVDER